MKNRVLLFREQKAWWAGKNATAKFDFIYIYMYIYTHTYIYTQTYI